jgi:uncharacterized protein (TIGR02996 family)
MTMTNVDFLKRIEERPDDDAPRLIYADWLIENGQTLRGEFIQIQCQLARETDPALPGRLQRREQRLLQDVES